jgi:hypothetical protein
VAHAREPAPSLSTRRGERTRVGAKGGPPAGVKRPPAGLRQGMVVGVAGTGRVTGISSYV